MQEINLKEQSQRPVASLFLAISFRKPAKCSNNSSSKKKNIEGDCKKENTCTCNHVLAWNSRKIISNNCGENNSRCLQSRTVPVFTIGDRAFNDEICFCRGSVEIRGWHSWPASPRKTTSWFTIRDTNLISVAIIERYFRRKTLLNAFLLFSTKYVIATIRFGTETIDVWVIRNTSRMNFNVERCNDYVANIYANICFYEYYWIWKNKIFHLWHVTSNFVN